MVQRKPGLTPPVTVQAVEHCRKPIDALSANERAGGVADRGAEPGLAGSRVSGVVPQNLFSGSRRGRAGIASPERMPGQRDDPRIPVADRARLDALGPRSDGEEILSPPPDAFAYHDERRGLDTWREEHDRIRRALMAGESPNRVQIAASHWKPRFIANGIDVNDFEKVIASTADWKDWAPAWQRMGDTHRGLAEEAARAGRTVTATDAYQRAAWCYHLGKFLWFEARALHDRLREVTVATYAKALPHLDPPGERVEVPFEGTVIPGILRRPRGATRPPLVILVPGLDSVKEELFAIENDFLRRGMATLTIDGPGQGENSPRFPIRPDWAPVIGPLLDGLRRRRGIDLDRIGLMGISMGGIYGPRAAALEKRLRAVIALAGPYDLSECWAALNPLTKGGYIFYTKSRDEAEAFEKAKALTLRGILDKVTCPLLVIHGGLDRLFLPEQAERIAREAPKATLLLYPDGNHVCNNIAYKYRPAMADWMRERLGEVRRRPPPGGRGRPGRR